jgi:hypothetical protein
MADYVGGNRLQLLRSGAQYFPALVAAIDAARAEVFLESYIYADDETGSQVADALARAAARGVATRLLIDGFGARDFAPRFRAMLSMANAEVLVFRPAVSPWPFWKQRSRLRRMHRKLACIDGAVAFIGGINVIDDYPVGIEGAAALRFRGAHRGAARRARALGSIQALDARRLGDLGQALARVAGLRDAVQPRAPRGAAGSGAVRRAARQTGVA